MVFWDPFLRVYNSLELKVYVVFPSLIFLTEFSSAAYIRNTSFFPALPENGIFRTVSSLGKGV